MKAMCMCRSQQGQRPSGHCSIDGESGRAAGNYPGCAWMEQMGKVPTAWLMCR